MLRLTLALPLLIPSCGGDETTSGYADPATLYHLEEIDGQPYLAGATLQFPEKGRLSGTAPCNRYQGKQPLPYPWFRAEGIAATRRACPDLGAENLFFDTLSQVTLVEVSGPILILSDDDRPRMQFRAAR